MDVPVFFEIPPLTPFVQNTLVLCGVPDIGLFEEQTPAQCMASDIFFDNFLSVVNTTREHVMDMLKAFASLTVTNSQIILQPGETAKTIAMIQWV